MAYTLVLRCKSAEDAQTVAAALRQRIEQIARWHVQHPFKSRKLFKNGRMAQPSPAESDLARTLDIAWTTPQGWLAVEDLAEIEDVVSAWEALVFVTAGEEDPAPLVALARTHGSPVLVDDGDGSLIVDIRAVALDAGTATQITRIIQTYFDRDTIAPAPWMIYSGGEIDPDAEALLALDPAYLRHLAAAQQDDYATTIGGLPTLNLEDAEWLDDVRTAAVILRGGIHTEGAQLTLRGLVFGEIASGLPGLVTWLRVTGCEQAVEYSFSKPEGGTLD
jgi:hypothetical protein